MQLQQVNSMSLLENVKQFLNDNKKLLNNYDFKTLYSSTKLVNEELGLMTNILLKAGFNPLQYLDHVPYAYLYGQTDVTNIEIPNNITYIDLYAFASCTNLKSVIIPNSVELIDDGVFSGCTSLTKIIIPNSVTFIGEEAFSGCISLTDIDISNSLGVISGYTFNDCRSLKSITIPDGVTTIGDYAFEDCIELTDVTINGDIEEIGHGAFCHCNKLVKIDYDSTREQWLKIDKNPSWSIRSKIKEINCTDGVINLRQVLTNPHV